MRLGAAPRTSSASRDAAPSPAGTRPPTLTQAAGSRASRRARRASSRATSGTVLPRRRRPPLLVRRAVLVGLLLVSLALLTSSYNRKEVGALGAVQMQVLRVVAPIEAGLSRAWAPVQGAYDWVNALLNATSENPELKRRVDELEARVSSTKVLEAENERLRDMLALKQRGRFPAGYRAVAGSVIGRSPTAIDHSVVIDLGTDDGLEVDDPVMMTRGLIGRVQAVSPNSARVALIINKAEAASAMVVGSNASGVVRSVSSDGSPVMELAYVSQRVQVAIGDLVVTSGWAAGELRSMYPRGVPIGVVSSVGNSPGDLYKTVQVTPFADFDRIDEVFVLTSGQSDQPRKPR